MKHLTEEERTAYEVYRDALDTPHGATVGVFLKCWVPMLFRNLTILHRRIAELEKKKK